MAVVLSDVEAMLESILPPPVGTSTSDSEIGTREVLALIGLVLIASSPAPAGSAV